MTYFVLNYDIGLFWGSKVQIWYPRRVPLCYIRMHETLNCPNHSLKSVCISLYPFMTYFVLNYDNLGYFRGQKWGFGTLVHCVISYA